MKEPGTILYAEDDERDIELTMEALREHNLANSVKVVRDGEEALDCLYRRGAYKDRVGEDPVLILLDIKMPKVDGLQVLRQIKSDRRLKTIPVVVLTSSREEKDLLESYQLGVNAYVVKPVDFENFVKAVKEIGLFWMLLNEQPLQYRRQEASS
jgi:CheY-like chemotaxis protein